MTCNEKQILYDDCQHVGQQLNWKKIPKPKFHQKVMVTVHWSKAGLIHQSFLNPRETITIDKDCQEIYQMCQKFRRVCPTLVKRKGSVLLQDNSCWPYVAQWMLLKLNELGYQTILHPPDSPDLSLTDYHFSKHLNNFLKQRIFNYSNAVQNTFQDFVASQTYSTHKIVRMTLVSCWQEHVESTGLSFS